MKWWVVVLVLGACKPKEVPYKPPPKDDAAVQAIDAAPDIDAQVATPKALAQKVVVGDHASCALLTDATLRCWGKNSEGQLGDGTTIDRPTPVMPNLRGVKDVVLGAAHACALLDDESVTCWGRINFGKRDNLTVPTAVPGLAAAKRIFALGAASCATTATGSFVCWGDVNRQGHLRLSGGATERRLPTPVAGLSKVVALTANGALKEDGTVWFWASDGEPRSTTMADVVEIASTGDEVCGLRQDGTVACAGPATRCEPTSPPKRRKTTTKGKRKPARPAGRSEPASVALPIEVLRLPEAKHLAFDVGLCVVTRDHKLQCLAAGDGCKLDAPWPGLPQVDYVTGNCARLVAGSARCWAVDTKSRLVREIAGVGGAIMLAASSSHACAVLGERSVVCWGSNRHGALGRGRADEQSHAQASAVAL